ncbi:MAG: hypothetical protein Q4Q62_05145 [Thermoplasmata archaeon]|nr:hypothetical protein [Thermoplasmata archaeon]
MISVRVGDCDVDIMPVVNGIMSEADRVRDAYGRHDAYGMALGIEGVQAIKERKKLDDDFEVSELDIAYSNRMTDLTGEEVRIPSPAMCVLVDLVTSDGGNVIALDMNDSEFTEMYCETVPAFDFVKEHRLAKKGMKKRFKSTTPEQFAMEWDAYVNTVKSYRQVSLNREAHIAGQIREAAKYRPSLLVLIEVERAEGVAALLRSA